jgi:16S rRNA (adenine1518-N6/adenine1519-N6)-dimethyltransferase
VQAAMHRVAKHSFHPIPNVDSAMLFLVRKERWFTFQKKTREMIRTIFTNRRKRIAKITSDLGINVENWMKRNEISPNTRPEQIAVGVWQDFENGNANLANFVKTD